MVTVAVLAIPGQRGGRRASGAVALEPAGRRINDLLGALSLARSESVRRNQRVVLCRTTAPAGVVAADAACKTDDTSGSWAAWMAFVDTSANGTRDAGEELLRSGVFASDRLKIVSSAALRADGNRLIFRPNGIARDQGTDVIQSVALRICEASDVSDNARDVVVSRQPFQHRPVQLGRLRRADRSLDRMSPTMNPKRHSPGTQSGTTLIEVLVAVVVLSIGLLGIAGLQLSALRNTQGAYERSAAVILANSLAERMAADRAQAIAGA